MSKNEKPVVLPTPKNRGTRRIGDILFVSISGYWRPVGKLKTIVRVYPPIKGSKQWLVILSKEGRVPLLGSTANDICRFEGREKEVWEKAVEWFNKPPAPTQEQPQEELPGVKKKRNKLTIANEKRKQQRRVAY